MENQQQQDRVAWIGLGLLGIELTPHLQKFIASQSLPDLIVWNRTVEKSRGLQASIPQIQIADSIEEIVTKYKANIIFTSLQNDDVVKQVFAVLTRVAASASYPITFVETGTLFPELSTQLKDEVSRISRQNHLYLQCPVFGRPEAARMAQMIWVCSGDPAGVQQVLPFINSMSFKVLDLKTADVAAGSSMKLLGNFMIGSFAEMMSESLNLARKSNLDPQNLIEFVDTFLPAPVYKDYSRRLVKGEEEPEAVQMTINVMSKDMGALKKWSDVKDAPMPSVDLMLNTMETAKNKGYTKNWNFFVDALNSK